MTSPVWGTGGALGVQAYEVAFGDPDYGGYAAWIGSGTAYVADGAGGPSKVEESGISYHCLITHSSDPSFAVDLAAGRWLRVTAEAWTQGGNSDAYSNFPLPNGVDPARSLLIATSNGPDLAKSRSDSARYWRLTLEDAGATVRLSMESINEGSGVVTFASFQVVTGFKKVVSGLGSTDLNTSGSDYNHLLFPSFTMSGTLDDYTKALLSIPRGGNLLRDGDDVTICRGMGGRLISNTELELRFNKHSGADDGIVYFPYFAGQM